MQRLFPGFIKNKEKIVDNNNLDMGDGGGRWCGSVLHNLQRGCPISVVVDSCIIGLCYFRNQGRIFEFARYLLVGRRDGERKDGVVVIPGVLLEANLACSDRWGSGEVVQGSGLSEMLPGRWNI